MTKADEFADTVLLPRTSFPMRANLPQLEPTLLARWDAIDLGARRAALARTRAPFTFHDGPPYANGPIHIGHVLNKSLKDMIHRAHWMLGLGSVLVPGWDCHGLPIEWRVEEDFRSRGREKSDIPTTEFRQACRDYATHWLSVQACEFKRLGVDALWDERYATMDFSSEARIIQELHKFASAGALYRTSRPVLWSPVEQTALAEAEVEYEDRTYLSVYVRFPVVASPHSALQDASLVIWTTTPWTLPGNRCIAYGPDVAYDVVEVEATSSGSGARLGERLVVAHLLLEEVMGLIGVTRYRQVASLDAAALSRTVTAHPLRGMDYDHDVHCYPADFVTTDQGSGFVHIAPACGLDDFKLGTSNGEPVVDLLDPAGFYIDSVKHFAGAYVFEAHTPVVAALEARSMLLSRVDHTQRYPHSWRSHAPLVFRATPQWFISMAHNELRARALHAIDEEIVWTPPPSKERIRSMVEQRPDWLISRQRVWGVPMALFVDKASGEILDDPAVGARIIEAVEARGAEAWFDTSSAAFLGKDHDPARYERVDDILDVWFDSGVSFALSSEARADTVFPASVVAEGSDQHRGYFQSSLLWSCGARGFAPYKACLTHGFVMDADGRKMSKSVGNVVAPQDVMERFGADILRLWVVASDYSNDLRVSEEILEKHADTYRKVRNTLRYMLGNLADFDEGERLSVSEMPALEQWVMHRLSELDEEIRRRCAALHFHRAFAALLDFCIGDLSALYFDVRKDVLYCEAPSSLARRAARTVLDACFTRLASWLSPFLPFTSDEAWLAYRPSDDDSVHLHPFPETPPAWRDQALDRGVRAALRDRSVVMSALEAARNAKLIGAGLQADVTLYGERPDENVFSDAELAELCLTASFKRCPVEAAPASAFRSDASPGVAVVVSRTLDGKCARCRRLRPDVGTGRPKLCARCDAVVANAA